MKKCNFCGSELEDSTLFCTNCGAKTAESPANGNAKPDTDDEEKKNNAPENNGTSAASGSSAAPAQEPVNTAGATAGTAAAATGAAAGAAFTAPAPQQQYQQQQYQQPSYTAGGDRYNYAAEPAPRGDGKYGVVGTGWYFGMTFVFGIPVVGFLVMLITLIGSRNKNKKHFAASYLIWFLIGLAALALVIAGIIALGGTVKELIEQIAGDLDLDNLLNGGLMQ